MTEQLSRGLAQWTVRPWADEGDYWEVILSDIEIHLDTLTVEEQIEAALRYIKKVYGV